MTIKMAANIPKIKIFGFSGRIKNPYDKIIIALTAIIIETIPIDLRGSFSAHFKIKSLNGIRGRQIIIPKRNSINIF